MRQRRCLLAITLLAGCASPAEPSAFVDRRTALSGVVDAVCNDDPQLNCDGAGGLCPSPALDMVFTSGGLDRDEECNARCDLCKGYAAYNMAFSFLSPPASYEDFRTLIGLALEHFNSGASRLLDKLRSAPIPGGWQDTRIWNLALEAINQQMELSREYPFRLNAEVDSASGDVGFLGTEDLRGALWNGTHGTASYDDVLVSYHGANDLDSFFGGPAPVGPYLEPCAVALTEPVERSLSMLRTYEPVDPESATFSAFESDLLDRVNEVRVELGLSTLANIGDLYALTGTSNESMQSAWNYVRAEALAFLIDRWEEPAALGDRARGLGGLRIPRPPDLLKVPIELEWVTLQYNAVTGYPTTSLVPVDPADHEFGVLRMLDYYRMALREAELRSGSNAYGDVVAASVRSRVDRLAGTRRLRYFRDGMTYANGRLEVSIYGATVGESYFVLSSEEGVLCALTGAVDGEPCDAMDYDYVPVSSTYSGSTDPIAARRTLMLADLVDGGTNETRSPLYVMGPGEGGTVLLDTFRYRHSDTNVFTPEGGALEREIERTFERSSTDCGVTKRNSLGLARDLIPPVETELVSDVDPFEDSFARYLDLATSASAGAADAINLAVEAELNMTEDEAVLLAQLDQLAASLGATVSDLCGATTAADCEVERLPPTTLGNLGLLAVVEPGVSGFPPEFGEAIPDCSTVNPDPVLDGPEDVRLVVDLLYCARNDFLGEVNAIPIRGLPLQFADGRLDDLERSALSGDILDKMVAIDGALLQFASIALNMVAAFTSARSGLNEILASLEVHEPNVVLNTARRINRWVQHSRSVAQCVGAIIFLGPATALGQCEQVTLLGTAVEEAEQFEAEADEAALFASGLGSLAVTVDSFRESISSGVLTILDASNGLALALNDLDRLALDAFQAEEEALAMAGVFAASANDVGPTARKLLTMANRRAWRALRRAVSAAFIARRAIEFRLVVELPDIRDPGLSGLSPAEWSNGLFSVLGSDAAAALPVDAQLLDYVTQLGDFVLLYPFLFPFGAGEDVAVLSMKDDLVHARVPCEILAPSTPNVLRFTEWLDRSPWTGVDVTVTTNAVIAPDATTSAETVESTSATGALMQDVDVGDVFGEWSASVYAKSDVPGFVTLFVQWVDASGGASAPVTEQFELAAGVWTRVGLVADLSAAPPGVSVIRYGLHPGKTGLAGGEVHLWGAQLEPGDAWTEGDYVRHPFNVDNPDCEPVVLTPGGPEVLVPPYDLDGSGLRLQFTPKCVFDAFVVVGRSAEDCSLRGGVEFYEARFSIHGTSVEDADLLGPGILAEGNYNYRLNRLAVNLVGTNVKDCTLDPTASCFANLFVPYELVQYGTVFLDDHAGVSHTYGLPEAMVHSGKAVAAEMVFTSPLSGPNQTVLDDFWKTELIGRPLHGDYALRVHNLPSLVWENLEDVQIILDYRYWSAFAP